MSTSPASSWWVFQLSVGLSGVPRAAVPTQMGVNSEGWGSWGAPGVDGEQGATPRAGWRGMLKPWVM